MGMESTLNPQDPVSPQAPSESPRERLERLLVVVRRTRMYIRSAVAVAVAVAALSTVWVMRMPRIWRSEVTILYRDTIVTDRPGSPAQRMTLLGSQLKDLLEVRSHLSNVVTEFDLYPEIAARSMVDAVAEMRKNVGFRSKKGTLFVISFSHGDPVMAQNVTARIAEVIIAEYHRENMETTTLNRDFLRRELMQAQTNTDDASRALSSFLYKNPQFQQGAHNSPYAPQPLTGTSGVVPPNSGWLPADPELSGMRQRLGTIEHELRRNAARTATVEPVEASSGLIAPKKRRDAAEAALKAAQDAFDEKLRTVTPAHPDAVAGRARLQAARDNLAEAERQLQAAQAESIAAPSQTDSLDPRRSALETEREVLLRRIADRVRALQAPSTEGDAGPSPGGHASQSIVDLETEWHRLQSELEQARDYLKIIQTKERAARISADVAEKKSDDELVIIDPAYLPIRPERGPGRMIWAGLAATLLMGFGVAFLRVLLNDTLFDEHDVRAAGGPAVLSELPRMTTPRPPPCEPIAAERAAPSDEIPIVWEPESEGVAELHSLVQLPPAFTEPTPAEADVKGGDSVRERGGTAALPVLASLPGPALGSLRVLRHRLEQLRGGEHFVVSVVSPGVGEGKTTLALRLAMILSEANRSRVALVEGNFGRPSLAATLGLHLPETEGFSAQIRRRLDGYRGPIGVTRIAPSLVVLAEPASQGGCPDALHSIHFGDAVRALRAVYDYVVIDGLSVLGSGDAHVLESVSDGVLVVARAGVTRGRDLRNAGRQLGDRRILGAVLNDLPLHARGADPTPANRGKAS
jgi:Mrp family chromosome partitioning ATPase/uncharacterized protein involved in exopolysaccharide biosynthesis